MSNRKTLNVIINNYCNLACEYCFAKNIMKKDYKYMSIHDFYKVLEWAKKNGIKSLKILGGEPTLHPNFIDIIETALMQLDGDVLIFSNCVFKIETLLKITDLNNKYNGRLFILPNVNDIATIGLHKWELLENNISILKKEGIVNAMGINIYSTKQDYSNYLRLASMLGIHNLRVALAINLNEKDTEKIFNQELLDFFTRFYINALELDLIPNLDCNSIPHCKLTHELSFAMLNVIYQTGIETNKSSVRNFCSPVIDVDYNLNIWRCFGFSSESDLHTTLEFDKSLDYYEHFWDEQDKKLKNIKLFDKCTGCNIFQNKHVNCGCLKYRTLKDE